MKIGVAELKGRTGHVAGRELLAQMYRAQTGKALPPLAYEKRGKPYIPGSSFHFSLSHTPRRVFCAVSDRPVGIDGEELDRQVRPGLAEKILSPGELAQYEQAQDKHRALLTFWVLKEAQAKCTGAGMPFHPTCTDFSLTDPRVTEMENCLVAVIERDN